jgi:hypothetical protein
VLLSLDADGGLTALLLSSGRVLLHRQLQEVPLAGHLNSEYVLCALAKCAQHIITPAVPISF